jgi:hypothetical protein
MAAQAGGGLYDTGTAKITNVTFAENGAPSGAGIYSEGADTTLMNTIVANSVGDNCTGTLIDDGNNLSWPDTTCPGMNVDPMLIPQAILGEWTVPVALDPVSPAINAGNDAALSYSTIWGMDQFGKRRPQGSHCEIGAFEYEQPNETPVITEGESTSVVMSVNGIPTAFNLTLHATDAYADTLTWTISTSAMHGTASVSGTGESKPIDYTPDTGYVGSDSFVVQVDDGNGGTDSITVNVTIAGMVSYWKLDEGNGTVANDSMEINDGEIHGATWTTGKVNGALSFDGDDYIEIPDSTSLTISDQVTVEAWVNIAEFTWDQNTIIAKWRDSEPFSHNYFLGLRSDGNAVFYVGLNGGITGTSSQPLQTGQWYHLTGTYNGLAVKLYVNGVLANSAAATGPLATGLTNAYIGASPEGQFPRYFHGLIDEAAVYNSALTLEDIQQHYQNGLSGLGYDYTNTPPVITEGDSASVTMSKNSSPTAFDLTLHATDADADTLTWSISSPVSHGTTSASGTGDSMVIGYTPDTDYIGSDSFVVQVEDENGGVDTITVNVAISFYLHVRAYIDGVSRLIVKGDAITWHHDEFDAPGRWGGIDPTYINEAEWYPTWPDIPNAANTDCNCDSSTLSGVFPALPVEDQKVTLNINQGYMVSIIQQPDAGNDYTLIIEFNDSGPGGANWYDVELFATTRSAAEVLHVTPGGTGDCSSWANACTLQSALTSASSGDEIWVAAGIYTPTTGTDRTATFQLTDDVAIYGGFAGMETERDQRNPAANVTILSGDLNGDDVGFANNSENVYHVITVTTGGTGTTLDGFTITGGNATLYRDSTHAFGGGMFISGSSPTLTNNIITGNVSNYGGGMYIGNGSNPTLMNITFSGNLAGGGFGGGVFNNNGSNPTFTNVTFSGNSAGSFGGGICNVNNSNPTLINATFTGNSAVGGGAINGGSPAIRNSIFWGNTAGGSTDVIGSQFYESTPTIFDSVVQGGCPDGSTCTNIITTDPKLGTLGNYGGSTQTISLQRGSSAIDAGNDATCATTDQRGMARPQGTHCDIGAFEYIDTNTPPVITEGVSITPAIYLKSPPIATNWTLHAIDAEADTLTWSISTSASHGTASASGTGASNEVSYTPNADYIGLDSFVVQVDDGNGGADSIAVDVTVRPNDPPIIEEGDSISRVMRKNGFPMPFTLTLFASDPNWDTLTWSISDAADHGTAGFVSGQNWGNLTYVPETDYLGSDSFDVTVSDGNGGTDTITVNVTIFTPPPEIVTYTQVSTGGSATCGLRSDGTLDCWGWNAYGQVMPPAGTFTQVSATSGHTCGLKSDGTLSCWGYQGSGVSNPPDGQFTQVSAGGNGGCGLKTDGSISCWYTGSTTLPEGTYTQVSAGSANHRCGLKSDGTLACAGSNYYGESTPPEGIYTQVSAGQQFICAVKSDETVACWGQNYYGQSVPPAGSFTQVSAGSFHACGLKTDGTIVCWGAGETNTGSWPEVGQSMPPTGTFTQVSAGDGNTCAVRTDGLLVCWGMNYYGQSYSSLPVITEGDVVSVSMSGNSSPTPFSLTLNATDYDYNELTWTISTPANHGTANVSGTGNAKAISYSPDTDYVGSDNFIVQIANERGGTDTITVMVQVTPHVPGHFNVDRKSDYLWVYGWQPGATLTAYFDDPANGPGVDFQITDVQPEVSVFFADEFDVNGGYLVTVSDGTTSATHVVTNLEITSADTVTDLVTGIAKPGIPVWVGNYSGPLSAQTVIPDINGFWEADFSSDDLKPGYSVAAHQYDENGNSTQDSFSVPNPNIQIRSNQDRVEGQNWPLGDTLTIWIDNDEDGLPEITRFANVAISDWDSSQTYFNYNFAGEFDIQADDVVTVTDGPVSRSTTVTVLSFTDVDLETNIVSGIASPDAHVELWICDTSNCNYRRSATANGTGEWQANFTGVYDIVPGTWIDSSENDANGNGTMYGVTIPNPRISVRANEELVEGSDWTEGATVAIEIDDPHTPLVNPDDSGTAFVGTADWNPNETYFDYYPGNGYNIEAGDVVTVADGDMTKTITVTDLAITGVDLDTSIVTGVADAGTAVGINVCDGSDCYNRHLTATGGNWMADFSQVGTQPDEQTTVDLRNLSGRFLDSWQLDAGGNGTYYGISLPKPRIVIRTDDDWLRARDWPEGTLLTLEIDDPDDGIGDVDYTTSKTAELGTDWGPFGTYADFDLNGFDTQPGQIITVSGGGIVRVLTPTDLTVTEVDGDANTVSGTATSSLKVFVMACDYTGSDCTNRNVTPDPDTHTWAVDLSGVIDLVAGSNGTVEQRDAVGNITRVNWDIPNPIFWVWPKGGASIETVGWPLGVEVTLKIDNPSTPEYPDYGPFTQITGMTPWPSSDQTYAHFSFPFDIPAGHMVSISDGVTTKTHTVANLDVTNIDPETNIVTGIAAPNSLIEIDMPDYQEATADGNGNWVANFNDIYDIVSDTWIEAMQSDSDGDLTMAGLAYRDTDEDGTTDLVDPCPDDATDTCDQAGSGAEIIGMDGGNLATENGKVALSIPSEALGRDVTLSITDMGGGYELSSDQGSMMVLHSYSIQPSGTQFDPSASITFHWDDVDNNGIVDGTSFNEADLFLGKDGIVIAGPCSIDPACDTDINTLSIQVSSLSLFALGAPANQPPVADAGGPYSGYAGSSISLSASNSTDPDNNIMSYEWDLDNDGQYDDASGVTVTTSFNQVGNHIVGLRVTDVDGLSDTDTVTLTVLPWTLKGFYQPVDMNGVYNLVKGGSTVPLKFEILTGSTELTGTASVKSLTYAQTSCNASAITDEIETTATGDTGLRYDVTIGQFVYNWKTPQNTGLCYRVTMTTMDGSSLAAYFKLK